MLHQLDLLLFFWLNSLADISPLFKWGIIFRAVYLIYFMVAAIFIFVLITFLPKYEASRASTWYRRIWNYAVMLARGAESRTKGHYLSTSKPVVLWCADRNYFKKNVELAILTFISALAARFVITDMIRFFYNRPRPFEVLSSVHQLISHEGGGSFPSGHAAFAFALAATVSFYYPKISILFFIAAFSIGMARVAAGVHWPSDILGGAVVGIAAAFLLRWIKERYWNTKIS